jgi:hypothetical protein
VAGLEALTGEGCEQLLLRLYERELLLLELLGWEALMLRLELLLL